MAYFKLSVITDEITQDFAHALDVAAKEFKSVIHDCFVALIA